MALTVNNETLFSAGDGSAPPTDSDGHGATAGIEDTELILFRSEYEKHFANEDGSITAVSYANPIHYKDDSGSWLDINNTLVSGEDGFVNKANPNEMRLSKTAKNKSLVSIKLKDYEFALGIEGINNVGGYEVDRQAKADRTDLTALTSKVLYGNAFENGSLACILSSCSLATEITFDRLPGFDSVTYNVETKNLTAVSKDGECIFCDATGIGNEIFRVKAPYMIDSAEKLSLNENIKMTLEVIEGGYALTCVLERQWLESEERIYPVILDLAVESSQFPSNILNISVSSNASKNNAKLPYLRVGKKGGTNYAWVKTINPPSLPDDVTCIDAKLGLSLLADATPQEAAEIWELQNAWNVNNLSWSTMQSVASRLVGNKLYPALLGEYYKYSIDVTSTAKKWYNNTMGNWGFLLKYQNVSYNDYNWIISGNNASVGPSNLPMLSVTYTSAFEQVG